jgi:hypothetical protein
VVVTPPTLVADGLGDLRWAERRRFPLLNRVSFSAMNELQPDDSSTGRQDTGSSMGPPAGSSISVDRFPDGLTIQVPPAGLWQGAKGLFVIALIWNGFFLVLSPCLLAAIFNPGAQRHGNPQVIWVLPLILSIFWFAGIGLLLASINMCRRKAAIAVTGSTLMVIQTGLFGTKQREWPPGEVEAVRAGPSGMTVNDEPVLELQILDGGTSKFGLLAGRSNEELYWIAGELREALRVPERP